MRTVAVLAALAAIVVPAAVAGGSAPKLHVVRGNPLTLRGDHFRGHERVLVVVHTNRPYIRVVVTRPDGMFAVEFANVSARCTGLRAVARGASGDRAVLFTPRPACTNAGIGIPAPGITDPNQ